MPVEVDKTLTPETPASARRVRLSDLETKIIAVQESLDCIGSILTAQDRRYLRDLCLAIAGKLDPDTPARTNPDGSMRLWGSQDE